GRESLTRFEDALQLDLVDHESRNAGRTLSAIQPRRRSDERAERIAAALRVVAVRIRRRWLFEDLLERFLHFGSVARVAGRGIGPRSPGRRRRRRGSLRD